MTVELDIVIPVYNEGRNIVPTLAALARDVRTPARVLICYDHENDDTLPAVRREPPAGLPIDFVRNRGRGAHAAVMAGFAASGAPFVLMYPADDDYNAGMVDRMVELARAGSDIVCPSRFMPGGGMAGCPFLKAALVRVGNLTLRHLARLPTLRSLLLPPPPARPLARPRTRRSRRAHDGPPRSTPPDRLPDPAAPPATPASRLRTRRTARSPPHRPGL